MPRWAQVIQAACRSGHIQSRHGPHIASYWYQIMQLSGSMAHLSRKPGPSRRAGCLCLGGRAASASTRWVPVARLVNLQLQRTQAVAVGTSSTDKNTQKAHSPTPASQADSAGNTICWTSYWWPVQAIENLNPMVPTHVDLLGKSMVIWGDSKGNWHCMEDKCPHRLAPLSEGRVEKDNIMCCYHGWTFSGNGSCTSIPQLTSDPKAHDNACSSKRSCVTSYPTRVENGLLWVWPEAGPEAAAKATASQPHISATKDCTPYYVRDMPIRLDSLIENTMDPSHIPYCHHGVLGDRNDAPNFTQTLSTSEVTKEGFMASAKGPFEEHQIAFKPPYSVFYGVNGNFSGPQFWMVPTKPGWARLFNNNASISKLPLLTRLKLNITALDHITMRSDLLDGHTYMLHAAEQHMPVSGGIGIKALVQCSYMPASSADAAVLAVRQWFQNFAGDVPTCSAAHETAMPPLMRKEQAMERYHQHTKQCIHCMKALATLDRIQTINVVVGLASAVAFVAQVVAAVALTCVPEVAAAAANVTAPSWAGAVGAAIASFWQACQSAGLQYTLPGSFMLAVLCYGLYTALTAMRKKFFYEDYVHALRD